MLHKQMCVASLLAALLMVVSSAVRAETASKSDIDNLRKEVEELRNKLNRTTPVKTGTVERALESKGYGPDAVVRTHDGRLVIGGLLQAWYYAPQTDHRGLFDDSTVNSVDDSNEGSQNNSFRIRRAEISFKMDIHENVTAFVKIDPAKEASSYPLVTDDQANVGYIYKSLANVGPQYASVNSTPGSTNVINNVQNGLGSANTMLEDAWINYHGVIPHHDFFIGQFRPFVGEEGIRSNAHLDFCERSFCGLLDDRYDLGAAFHGSWWDERFQYWGQVLDGAGNFFGSATSPEAGGVQTQTSANRSDDNSRKDIGWRILLRPVYKNETWGDLEIGAAGLYGWHGSSNNLAPLSAPDEGLTSVKTNAYDYSAWLCYKPSSVVCGLWLRGEWKFIRDRMAPGSVTDLAAGGVGTNGGVQEIGRPLHTQGYYAAIGYKLEDSTWRDSCPCWLRPFEFAGRYQTFQNVLVANSSTMAATDTKVYATQVATAGINYYIKGHDAKIQANYNFVKNPSSDTATATFHNTRDDSFVVNFQVAF